VIVFSIGRDSFGLLIESVPEVADVTPADPGSHPARGGDFVMLKGQPDENPAPPGRGGARDVYGALRRHSGGIFEGVPVRGVFGLRTEAVGETPL
jgi:hypothetical protein